MAVLLIHTNIQKYTYIYKHTDIHKDILKYIYMNIHICIHTYIHKYIYTLNYIPTDIEILGYLPGFTIPDLET